MLGSLFTIAITFSHECDTWIYFALKFVWKNGIFNQFFVSVFLAFAGWRNWHRIIIHFCWESTRCWERTIRIQLLNAFVAYTRCRFLFRIHFGCCCCCFVCACACSSSIYRKTYLRHPQTWVMDQISKFLVGMRNYVGVLIRTFLNIQSEEKIQQRRQREQCGRIDRHIIRKFPLAC